MLIYTIVSSDIGDNVANMIVKRKNNARQITKFLYTSAASIGLEVPGAMLGETMKKKLNVAIIGSGFMGKAHSNAWRKASRFFDLGAQPVLKVACGIEPKSLSNLTERWGWERTETDWRKAVRSDDIDIVDIVTPTFLHLEMAVEAARAGKHIFCEKPMALDASEAQQMYEAVEKAGVKHFLNHNYRRCPAVRLAKRLIDRGDVGRIFHWRGAYLQDWIIDPEFPLVWQLQKEKAGAGPHADLGSHSVDLARYLVGEIKSVTGMTTRFVANRPLADDSIAGAFKGGASGEGRGEVSVEDASFMVAEFANGALGSFEFSRFCHGRKNYNSFEIYGEKGAILFDFERMNELRFYSAGDPADARGYRTILATDPSHDYMSAWWPSGHPIGYEHTLVHGMAEFVNAIARDEPISPNFLDGLRTARVLDAALVAASGGTRVQLAS
jgi:predicted dehydrogenase